MAPRTAAVAGIALGWVGFALVVFVGYPAESAACPDRGAAGGTVGVVAAILATAGFALTVFAYRRTAGAPSSEWLLGAAGLYLAALAWAATLTGTAALLAVDVCAL